MTWRPEGPDRRPDLDLAGGDASGRSSPAAAARAARESRASAASSSWGRGGGGAARGRLPLRDEGAASEAAPSPAPPSAAYPKSPPSRRRTGTARRRLGGRGSAALSAKGGGVAPRLGRPLGRLGGGRAWAGAPSEAAADESAPSEGGGAAADAAAVSAAPSEASEPACVVVASVGAEVATPPPPLPASRTMAAKATGCWKRGGRDRYAECCDARAAQSSPLTLPPTTAATLSQSGPCAARALKKAWAAASVQGTGGRAGGAAATAGATAGVTGLEAGGRGGRLGPCPLVVAGGGAVAGGQGSGTCLASRGDAAPFAAVGGAPRAGSRSISARRWFWSPVVKRARVRGRGGEEGGGRARGGRDSS